MNGVQQFDAFFHGLLEGFAARDETHTAGSLVDYGSHDGLFEVVLTGGTAGVDQTLSAHVAVGYLVAGQVDGVVGGQFAVNAGIGFAEFDGIVAAVVFGQFLLDDVGFDGDTEVVGLTGEVGGHMVVGIADFEAVIAQVAPENCGHAQFVSFTEGYGDFLNLTG